MISFLRTSKRLGQSYVQIYQQFTTSQFLDQSSQVQLPIFNFISFLTHQSELMQQLSIHDSRAIDIKGQISTSLLSSKTRVAPVKSVSLPRLEQCGPDLAAMLAATSVKILSVVHKDICIYAWTDYALVLQWLAQLSKTWSTFVANRVAQIQPILPQSNWNHVSSVESPADLASRGFSA